MDSRAESRFESAALIAIVGVGVAVRLGFLSRPMQLDEAYTYNEYAARPILDGLSWYTLPNNHLLNTLLIHLAAALLGNARWAVRLPAFAAGVALIPATYSLVARLCGRSPALLAAALVAASGSLIDYSTNARGYTMVCLVTVLLADRACRIGFEGGKARDWAWFTVLPALGFFAIPIMLYPYGGIVLWLVLASRWPGSRSRARRVRLDRLIVSGVFSALLTILLYLPAVIRMGLARVAANPYVAPRPWGEVVRELPGSLGSAWLQWNRGIPRAVAVLFLLVWIGSLVRFALGRRGCAAPSGLLLTILGWSLSAALLQRVVPYDRVWLFAAPLYAGCVGEGLNAAIEGLPGRASGRLARSQGGLAVALCLGLAVLAARSDALGPKSWLTLHHADAMVRLLKPILTPDDGVIAMTPCDAPLKYEFLRHGVPVEHLYDYRIARARRLFVAVNRPGQDVAAVLAHFEVPASLYSAPRLIRDFGASALYELDRL